MESNIIHKYVYFLKDVNGKNTSVEMLIIKRQDAPFQTDATNRETMTAYVTLKRS